MSSGGAGIRRLVYDGDALVAEYDSAGNMPHRYIHGNDPGADDPLIWYDNFAGGWRRALLTDHQGSVIQVADMYGTPIATNTYDAWGIPGGKAGRFGYTGQTWLPELGLWYYKARIYSPTLGRFLQTDPVGYEDQVNLYAYVGNDPVNRVDPSGQSGKLVGVVVQVGRRGVRDGIRDTIRETRNAWNALRSDAPTSTGTKLRATVELITGIPLYTEGRSDEERSAEGRHIITEGQEPDGIQIDNRGEGRNVTNVLEEAANVAGVPVGETRDGKPTVVFPDGSRATGYPESRTTGAPSIEIRGPRERIKTREDNF